LRPSSALVSKIIRLIIFLFWICSWSACNIFVHSEFQTPLTPSALTVIPNTDLREFAIAYNMRTILIPGLKEEKNGLGI
jgi:hypothetical protein